MIFAFDFIDFLLFLILVLCSIALFYFQKTKEWGFVREKIAKQPRYLVALMILLLYVFVGALDSIHFRENNQFHSKKSLLDVIFSPMDRVSEVSYSAPFSTQAHNAEFVTTATGDRVKVHQRLEYAGGHLVNPEQEKLQDIMTRIVKGVFIGLFITLALYLLFKKTIAQKTFWVALGSIVVGVTVIFLLMQVYHVLGTDKIGRDVFYLAMKSVRTGLAIGTITTLIMLPFALLLGLSAGYLGGFIDDLVHYLYTTLSSVPGVLLIAASMLSFQTKIQTDPNLRLLILCSILGLTSWIMLCRLLRGEALKLRDSDFIQSAIVLGTSRTKIIFRHILPNLMHIVIISIVLDFSGLVLAEAILSYIGVGVDPTFYSWGNMINASRLDMAREPIVWWSLCGALFLMFALLFAVNVLSDALQEALNPKVH